MQWATQTANRSVGIDAIVMLGDAEPISFAVLGGRKDVVGPLWAVARSWYHNGLTFAGPSSPGVGMQLEMVASWET